MLSDKIHIPSGKNRIFFGGGVAHLVVSSHEIDRSTRISEICTTGQRNVLTVKQTI